LECCHLSQHQFLEFVSFAAPVLPLYNKLSPRDQGEWVTRVSSTVNAFVTGFLCLYALCTDDELWRDGVYYRAPPTMYAIAIAAAYFFIDFLFITYYRIPPLPPIIVHHVLAGWGFTGGLGPIGRFPLFGSLLLLTEFTTPFNNFEWFLDKSNLRDTAALPAQLSRCSRCSGWCFASPTGG
jgi:hypothetical protein